MGYGSTAKPVIDSSTGKPLMDSGKIAMAEGECKSYIFNFGTGKIKRPMNRSLYYLYYMDYWNDPYESSFAFNRGACLSPNARFLFTIYQDEIRMYASETLELIDTTTLASGVLRCITCDNNYVYAGTSISTANIASYAWTSTGLASTATLTIPASEFDNHDDGYGYGVVKELAVWAGTISCVVERDFYKGHYSRNFWLSTGDIILDPEQTGSKCVEYFPGDSFCCSLKADPTGSFLIVTRGGGTAYKYSDPEGDYEYRDGDWGYDWKYVGAGWGRMSIDSIKDGYITGHGYSISDRGHWCLLVSTGAVHYLAAFTDICLGTGYEDGIFYLPKGNGILRKVDLTDSPVSYTDFSMPILDDFHPGCVLPIDYNAPPYDSGTTYSSGNVVEHLDGGVLKVFEYINATPSAGNAPPNAAYWELVGNAAGSFICLHPAGLTSGEDAESIQWRA